MGTNRQDMSHTRSNSRRTRNKQGKGNQIREAALIPDDRIPLGGTLLRTRLSKELWRMNGVGGYGGGLQVKNEAADDGEKPLDRVITPSFAFGSGFARTSGSGFARTSGYGFARSFGSSFARASGSGFARASGSVLTSLTKHF
ncbi:unnamed protein product [Cochlearia groenlandica]